MRSGRLLRIGIAAEIGALALLVVYRGVAIGSDVFATRNQPLQPWVPYGAGAYGALVLVALLYWVLQGASVGESRRRALGWLVFGALAFALLAFYVLYVHAEPSHAAPTSPFFQTRPPGSG